MSNLSSTLLTFRKPTTLLEAEGSKYGLSDEIVNGTKSENDTEGVATPVTNDPNSTGDTSVSADDNPETTEDDSYIEGTSTPVEDDPTSPADESDPANAPEDEYNDGDSEMDEYGEEDLDGEGEFSEDDVTAEAQSTPGLRILTTISDKQYKLCNTRIYEKFQELIKEVDDSINNVIMDITPRNNRETQVVEIVHNNLSQMKSDINNYLIYTFGDTYESNVIAYMTYLKRYKIAMEIIHSIIKSHSNNFKK